MLLHVIKHDRSGNKSFATQRASVWPFPRVISSVDGKRGRLGKRLAAHGAKVRSLASVDALMHHVIFAMSETFAAYVAHERPGPVHGLVRGQRLDAGKLFGT